ncbi:MAG: sigma 54-interacting transcriptional regulator [Desulfosarcinaceae bacterium]
MNRYWGRVIDTLNEALLIISIEGTILAANRAFEEMTGYPAGKIAGQPCTLLRCDACEKVIKNDGRVWCTLFEKPQGEIRKCRCQILKQDGTYIPALKNASVLYDEDGTQLGAVETFTDISELDRLDRQVAYLSRQLDETDGYCGIIGRSEEMRRVFNIIEKAAQSDAPVIIYGESGTGKELVAQAIHNRGQRKNAPYVQVNCAALNESLLESELFGHVRGSFTGALRDRKGRFESAHGGDLFLDEIGDVPLSIQIKLLRALEAQQFERVGDDAPIVVDVRIITATNKDLLTLIARGGFREDLYFRINVIPIHLPPLRERREDIPLLVETFVQRLRAKTGKPIGGIHREAMARLMAYPFPGNVRELKSALQYAFTIAEKGPLGCIHLPPQICTGGLPQKANIVADDRADRQRRDLIDALRQTGGNQTRAAELLNINRVTVWNRMRRYGIDLKRELRVSK